MQAKIVLEVLLEKWEQTSNAGALKEKKEKKQEGMFFSLLFWLSQTFKRVNMFPAGILHDFDSHCAETDLRHI